MSFFGEKDYRLGNILDLALLQTMRNVRRAVKSAHFLSAGAQIQTTDVMQSVREF